MVWIFVSLVGGIITGSIITTIIFKKKYSQKALGSLKIDDTDPDGPYMFLELNTNVSTLSQQDYVILSVDISQK